MEICRVLWFGGIGCRGHDRVDDAQGVGLSLLDWGVFNPVSFELSGELLVQADVILGGGGGFGFR